MEEFKALKDLRKRDKMVIKKANRGSAAVDLDKEDYLQEDYRQLNNQDNYLKLASDSTPTFSKHISDKVNDLYHEDFIDKKTKFFSPFQVAKLACYLLYKRVTGLTIVSSINSQLKKISSC